MFLVSGFMSTQYTEFSVVSKSALNNSPRAALRSGPVLPAEAWRSVGFCARNHIECMKSEIKSEPYFCTVLNFILELTASWLRGELYSV